MTPQETIQAMKFYKEKLCNGIFNDKIGAFDVAISALGKQIPKKPNILTWQLLINAGWKHGCPNCGCAVGMNKHLSFAYEEYLEPNESFCCSCGQALDWGG